jgi:hypothetical protein
VVDRNRMFGSIALATVAAVWAIAGMFRAVKMAR